jgi:hypothetical protein
MSEQPPERRIALFTEVNKDDGQISTPLSKGRGQLVPLLWQFAEVDFGNWKLSADLFL